MKRPIVLLLTAAIGLFACVPLPVEAPPLDLSAFPSAAPTPAGLASAQAGTQATPNASGSAVPTSPPFDAVAPFAGDTFVDVETPTKFKPSFAMKFNQLIAGGSPTVSLDTYQTKGELEVKELHALIEGASLDYATLTVGQQVGFGRMDIGTPPKITLNITILVTQTDHATFATTSVKASGPLANVYVADVLFKQRDGNLSIVSVSNFARGNEPEGVHVTEVSARVVQDYYSGFFRLGTRPGAAQSRVLLYSEPDPAGGGTALRVHRQTLGIAPAP